MEGQFRPWWKLRVHKEYMNQPWEVRLPSHKIFVLILSADQINISEGIETLSEYKKLPTNI